MGCTVDAWLMTALLIEELYSGSTFGKCLSGEKRQLPRGTKYQDSSYQISVWALRLQNLVRFVGT